MVVISYFTASFRTAARGVAWTKALSYSLSTLKGRFLRSSSSKLSLPQRNTLNQHHVLGLIVVPGPNDLLISRAVSAAFRSSFHWKE